MGGRSVAHGPGSVTGRQARLGDQAAVIGSLVGDGVALALASGRAAVRATLRSRSRSTMSLNTQPALRIATGLVFLWAFLDKLLGLGYATPTDRAWINGGIIGLHATVIIAKV